MELEKYDLQPQQQLAVSLYLKSMNKAQASKDAGFSDTAIFKNPKVKAVIAEQLSIRAERLRVGGDWVLSELKRVYDRCMQMEKELDRDGNLTGELRFDAANALKALALIGKHTDVAAFKETSKVPNQKELIQRLNRARNRVAQHPSNSAKEISFLD